MSDRSLREPPSSAPPTPPAPPVPPAPPAAVPAPAPEPERQINPVQATLDAFLQTHSAAAIRDFSARRNTKAMKMFNEVIEVINKHDPEPDMAVYVATLLYNTITRDACARVGIK